MACAGRCRHKQQTYNHSCSQTRVGGWTTRAPRLTLWSSHFGEFFFSSKRTQKTTNARLTITSHSHTAIASWLVMVRTQTHLKKWPRTLKSALAVSFSENRIISIKSADNPDICATIAVSNLIFTGASCSKTGFGFSQIFHVLTLNLMNTFFILCCHYGCNSPLVTKVLWK